jgi:hypothetical protein
MTDEKQASGEAVLSSDGLGARTSFAPTVVMPGGGTVTPEGWMWVLGFALAGCEWAIEAAERDNLHQKAMDYLRRRRIYWQEKEVSEAEERLATAQARLAKEKETLAALVGPNGLVTGCRRQSG